MQPRPWYLISILGLLDDAFAGSPISISLSHHKFELNTVPGSGPGSQSALAAVGPRIIKPQSERKRITRQSVKSWKNID